MGGSPSVPEERLPPERTFIVTGANTGIGYTTAKKIAQLGGRVIIACRSEQKANDAMDRMKTETQKGHTGRHETKVPELNVQFMHLDLCSLESTIDFAFKYKESGLPLHVLICNAGLLAPLERTVTDDGFELGYQVNYLSHFLLTLLLLPLLKESAPNSRIINVSSKAYMFADLRPENIQCERSYHNMRSYSNSKLYQVMNMYSLARAISGCGVSIFSLHPGFVDTDIVRESHHQYFRARFTRWASSIAAMHADNGARTTLIAALDRTYDGETALYFEKCKPCGTSRTPRNEEKQNMLWTYSLQCLRRRLDDVILREIGEKLENIRPLGDESTPDQIY